MIKLQAIGHLGKDCSLNQVGAKNVINFSIAHTEKYKDSAGNPQEKTIWVECAYWTERTGIAPYLKKGTQVFVDGSPELRTYTKTDGSFGASLTLRVQSLQLLGQKEGGVPTGVAVERTNTASSSFQPTATISSQQEPPEADDLPF